MQNKVIVFSDNQNLTSKCLEKIEKSLLKRGLFDFSFLSCSLYADCVGFCIDAKNSYDNAIIICDNDNVDKLVEASKTDTDNLTLIQEQAIKLEHIAKCCLFQLNLILTNFWTNFCSQKMFFLVPYLGKVKILWFQNLRKLKHRKKILIIK